MIIHKLAWRFIRHGDDPCFYALQARDTVEWLAGEGVELSGDVSALDLGAGLGLIGEELRKRACRVTYADEADCLLPELDHYPVTLLNLDSDDLEALGQYDLVICSNVLEHLSRPEHFVSIVDRIIAPGGMLYLSWTNWLSPWGGHEFSPFHYLGPRLGPRVYDRVMRKPRKHTPYTNLFPTAIGRTLKWLEANPGLKTVRVVPRYYPELAGLVRVPIAREFLTWNCAVLLEKA